MSNRLYFGDNLEVMRRYLPEDSVDLVYLDPPFNSNATYSALFSEQDGTRSTAQIAAFEDTWHWDQSAVVAYEDAIGEGGAVADALLGLRTILGHSDMLAYLSMMAPRLIELRRVLKNTGSLYLHCDPNASHYLKLLLDAVFGQERFLNEIVWQRTSSHGRARKWGPVHDVLLFYSVTSSYTWNRVYQEYDEQYIRDFYRFEDAHGRYQRDNLMGPGVRHGSSGGPWRGVDPSKIGRHWELPPDRALPSWFTRPAHYSEMDVQERLDVLDAAGLIYWPARGSTPRFKRYLATALGNAIQDVITDIDPISSQAAERLGYPTQKPLELLERIIRASSNPGDVVLDPFCGCGTAVDAAQRLGRTWIGIDITHLAVNLIRHRLLSAYGNDVRFDVVGEPVDLEGAVALAASDPYQFQWWALGLVGARPTEQRRGADHGIDGRLFFRDEQGSDVKQVLFSVKAGHVTVSQVRDLRGVLDRDGAAIGVMLTMASPTRPMKVEAASAGTYESPWGQKYPRLQILTIAEILDGRRVEMPDPGSMSINVTHRRAQRVRKAAQVENPPTLL